MISRSSTFANQRLFACRSIIPLKPKTICLSINNPSAALTTRTVLSFTLWSSLRETLDIRFSTILGDHLLVASLFASNKLESGLANRTLSLCDEVYGIVVENLAWPAFRTHNMSTRSDKSDVEFVIGGGDTCYM